MPVIDPHLKLRWVLGELAGTSTTSVACGVLRNEKVNELISFLVDLITVNWATGDVANKFVKQGKA